MKSDEINYNGMGIEKKNLNQTIEIRIVKESGTDSSAENADEEGDQIERETLWKKLLLEQFF